MRKRKIDKQNTKLLRPTTTNNPLKLKWCNAQGSGGGKGKLASPIFSPVVLRQNENETRNKVKIVVTVTIQKDKRAILQFLFKYTEMFQLFLQCVIPCLKSGCFLSRPLVQRSDGERYTVGWRYG